MQVVVVLAHFAQACAAEHGQGVVASGRAGGGGRGADLDQAFAGQSGEDGVDGGLSDGQSVDAAELLEQLVAVGFAAAERGQDAQLDDAFAQLFDLVPRHSTIFGYRRLSLTRALSVVNCQSTPVWRRLRPLAQA